MKVFPIEFMSQGQRIRGLGYGPAQGVAKAVRVILIHGYASSKHSLDGVATALSKEGYPVLSVDLPGSKLGASGGVLSSFETVVQVALDADTAFPSPCRPLFVGHSMGAAAAIVAASRSPQAAGAVSLALGYPITVMRSDPMVIGHYLERWDWIDGASPIEVGLAMDALVPGALKQLGDKPFLLISGRKDQELPPSSAETLFDLAHEPKVHQEVDTDHAGVPSLAGPLLLEWLNSWAD